MRSRLPVGQVLAFAVPIVVAGVIVAALLREPTKAGQSPWGSLPRVAFASDGSRPMPTGSQDIGLKIAKIAAPAASSPSTDGALAGKPPADAVVSDAPAAALPAPEPAPNPAPTAQAGTPVAASAVASADSSVPAPVAAPEQQAMLTDPSAASDATVASPDKTSAGSAVGTAVDINKASVQALDRLPGVGKIGKAVVKHRPYRSIDELVAKRVLRNSDFQKIRSSITVE